MYHQTQMAISKFMGHSFDIDQNIYQIRQVQTDNTLMGRILYDALGIHHGDKSLTTNIIREKSLVGESNPVWLKENPTFSDVDNGINSGDDTQLKTNHDNYALTPVKSSFQEVDDSFFPTKNNNESDGSNFSPAKSDTSSDSSGSDLSRKKLTKIINFRLD